MHNEPADSRGCVEGMSARRTCSTAKKKKIACYARNDDLRIKNIEGNYLQGNPSGFAPGHKLSETVGNSSHELMF